MRDTTEYVVAPKLAHQLIGIGLSAVAAVALGYWAMTNTQGMYTRRTNLSPEMLTTILWVLCVCAALLALVILAELLLTRNRPPSTIKLTATEFSIPMNSAFKQRTVSGRYDQVTKVKVLLSSPNRVLRIEAANGAATVAELNVGTRAFHEIHAAFVNRAPSQAA